MRKFVNHSTYPPNGYKYTCPETNDLLEGGDFRQLVAHVRQYRERAGLPCPPNLPEIIENDVCCHNNFPGFCVGTFEPGASPATRITANEIREATRIKLKLPLDRALISRGEADRRAKICMACPLNAKGVVCTSCDGLAATVKQIVGDRKTTYDPDLGLCLACKCLLQAKVWVSEELMRLGKRPDNLSEYHASCWVPEIWAAYEKALQPAPVSDMVRVDNFEKEPII